ncbi:Nmad5 family putative nucleotide modification protein [Escherichia coli]
MLHYFQLLEAFPLLPFPLLHLNCTVLVRCHFGSETVLVTINVLYDEVDAFQLQVKGALTKVSTVKKLAEMWPEAVPYLPEVERREATSTALAIPVETLNALCGIPKNE